MEWIKTSERLPEEKSIIIYHHNEVYGAYFSKGKFYGYWNPYARLFEDRLEGVKYWMPLPEPPKDNS